MTQEALGQPPLTMLWAADSGPRVPRGAQTEASSVAGAEMLGESLRKENPVWAQSSSLRISTQTALSMGLASVASLVSGGGTWKGCLEEVAVGVRGIQS